MTQSMRNSMSPQQSPRGSAKNNPDIMMQMLAKMTDVAEFQTTLQDQIKGSSGKLEKQMSDLRAEMQSGLKALREGIRILQEQTDKLQAHGLAVQLPQRPAADDDDGFDDEETSRIGPSISTQRSSPFKQLTKQGTALIHNAVGALNRGSMRGGNNRGDIRPLESIGHSEEDRSVTGSHMIGHMASDFPIPEEGSQRNSKTEISDSDGDELDASDDPIRKARRSVRNGPRPSQEGHRISQSAQLGMHSHALGDGHAADGEKRLSEEKVQSQWPATLDPRPEFTSRVKAEPTSRDELLALIFRNKVKQSREGGQGGDGGVQDGNSSAAVATPERSSFAIHPDSMPRVTWDVMSVIVLVSDMALVPFILSWHIELGDTWLIFSMATFCFWCTDMFMSFITGFYSRGTLFMGFKAIAHHYIHGWFMLDASILTVDLVTIIILSIQGQHTRMGQILRAAKLFRLIRVTRLIKLFESVLHRNISDTARIVMQISQQVVWIVWTTHILCCAWYAIGKFAPTDTGERWLDLETGPGVTYVDAGTSYQYFTALHWGASQIAAGNMDLQPLSTAERAFNTLCLVFGLIVGSALVSSLSATMMDLREARQEQTKQLRLLRQYMVQNNIEPETMVRMQKHAMDRMAHQRLKDEDVPALQLLSASLQVELRWSAFRPSLVIHAFFRLIEMLDTETFRKLCNNAVEFIYPSYGDEVFTVGERAIGAFVMVFGKMQYIQHPASAMVEEEQITDVEEGAMCAEASLFSMWLHVGSAVSSFSCQLMRIRARSFARIINRNPLTREVTEEYARRFHAILVNAHPPHSSYPTDLHVPFTGFSEVVLSMAQPYQEAISRITFENFQMDQNRHIGFLGGGGKGLQELEDEVRSGSCTLLENGKGETERVVALCVLRVEDEHGHIFTHIGTWETDGGLPKAKLPGAKQKAGEMSSDTVARLLKNDLKVMASKVELLHSEQVTEVKESASYHINTIYLKTIQHAQITGTFDCTKFVCSFSLIGGSDSDAHGSYVPLVPSRDIYVIPDGRKYAMYTWLRQEEFDFLGKKEGQQALAHVLERVRAEPNISELVENSVSRRNVRVTESH